MENKIIITKDAIIKVRSIEKGILIGYNIFTEELIQIPNSGYMEITEQIISLLGCEEKRLRLSYALCKSQSKIAKMMGLSDRSVFRLEDKHMNYTGTQKVNQKSQLTEEDVLKIKEMCNSKKYTRLQIAEKFEISKTTVRNIHLNLQSYSK